MAQNPILDQWESGSATATPLRLGARGCAKKNIVGNGTTTVKASAGALHCLQVNTRNAGGTATIYDNTAASGAIIAVVDTGFVNSASNTLFYDLAFKTGLTVVIANAANLDCVIAYQ